LDSRLESGQGWRVNARLFAASALLGITQVDASGGGPAGAAVIRTLRLQGRPKGSPVRIER
jgi:hypothetical protein